MPLTWVLCLLPVFLLGHISKRAYKGEKFSLNQKISILKYNFFIAFRERAGERGRGRERERNIDIREKH